MSAPPAVIVEQSTIRLDLGQLWRAVWHGRRTILACAVIGALLGATSGLAIRIIAPRYSAESQIVLTGSKYRLQLDPKFTTVDIFTSGVPPTSRAEEYRAIITSQQTRTAASARAAALAADAAAANAAVAQAALHPQIRGNLITLRVSAPSPELAALAVTAYTEAVVARLDEVYATTEQDLRLLEARLAEATAANEAAEAAVVRFLETSPLPLLGQRITQQKQLLDTLSAERRLAIESEIGRAYSLLGKLEELRQNGLTLREQLRASTQSPASRAAAAVSLFLLQRDLALLSASRLEQPDTPENRPASPATIFQLDLSVITGQSLSSDTLLSDVEAFLRLVEQRKAEVLDSLAATAATLASLPSADSQPFPVGQLGDRDDALRHGIAALSADLARKEAERQAAQFRFEALTTDAKLTRDARAALVAKVQETLIAAASSGRAIVVSTTEPVDAHAPVPTWLLGGAALGLIGGTVLAGIRALRNHQLSMRSEM
ncbi:MAG: Wzz/FepE/Etk N-terminal domain-containing protein [Chloroflexota bacterium]|nr:Wzz/FepE/Etk N-terminal domain-containing protein [Dehalococcoidia bacterium]MDW8252648.1 Wzz/FepE/Etk N-terminal domain-containing protein [Chloroflexota bacterium]